MTVLHRYSALVAILLLVTVTAQMLDMGLCCELRRPAPSQMEAKALLSSEGGVSGDLLASGGEGGERGSMAQPDCLCHLVFASTGAAPALQAAVIPISTVAEAQESPYSTPLSPPGHVPLA